MRWRFGGCMTYVMIRLYRINQSTFAPLSSLLPSFFHRPLFLTSSHFVPITNHHTHAQRTIHLQSLRAHRKQRKPVKQSHDQVATAAKVLESSAVFTTSLHVAADKSWIVERAFSSTAANTFHG
jgi:hypothetical protein